MYLRTTQRRNKDGSIVRYSALAENVRHPEKGHVEAKVVHSFGRADRLDRAALERLVRSIRRVLDADGSAGSTDEKGHERAIEIAAGFDLGVVHAVEQLWARLGIGRAIATRLAADERQAPHEAALLAMTAQRLDRPGSKLACHERWRKRLVGLDGVGARPPTRPTNGCPRPRISPSTSSIVLWICWPSMAMRSRKRCSGTASICSG